MFDTIIKCGCNGQTYLYTPQGVMNHFRTETHQNWIKADSANLHENILVQCPCNGEIFSFYTQLAHLKTSAHKAWQNIDDRKNIMPFICQCSFIVPYGKLATHREYDLHIVPTFDITRKEPWKVYDRVKG